MDARRTAIGGSTVMTATEAIEWIAHRRRMTWLEVNAEQREYEDWCLTLDGSAIRKAAQAMASGLPEYRLWEPAPADAPGGRADTGPSYLRQMSAPGVRGVLETICARLEKRFGRPVSFAELAERIEPEMARFHARFQARREALAELIETARGGQLTATGQLDGEGGYSDETALVQPIPRERWEQPSVSLGKDRLTWLGSSKRGTAERSFSNVRFKTADVVALWPAGAEGGEALEPSAQTNSERPPSPQSLWTGHAKSDDRPPFLYASAYSRFFNLKKEGQPRMTRPEMEALIEREFRGKPTDKEMRALMKIWPNRMRGPSPRNAPKPPAHSSGNPRKS